MDSGDAFLLLAGAVVGGLAVYMLFFRSQSYAVDYPGAVVYRPLQGKAEAYSPIQKNEETWEWTDWRGSSRKIIVHREVKRLVQ